MFEVKLLSLQKDAVRLINFFYSKNAFEQTWAPGEKDTLKKSVLQSVSEKNHPYWYVENQKKIIGAIGIRENIYKSGGFEMSEDYFAVHKDYRRSGIGTLLLKKAEGFVKKNHGRYIHILSCDTNYFKPAQLFYKKNGYRKVGEMPDYYVIGEGRIDYYKNF